MTDRPILFSGPMVRAILEGRKTQTRRVLNRLAQFGPISEFGVSDTSGYHWRFRDRRMQWHDLLEWEMETRLPFAPGDRLWVREHWRTVTAYQDLAPSEMAGEEPIRFEADGAWETRGWYCDGPGGRHRQGMHMPRWASRLTLIVTDVRVQRLQEISETDAKAEGPHQPPDYPNEYFTTWTGAFRALWDSLNAKRGFGWDENPWIVAISFEAHRCNIDQLEAA